MCDPVYEAFRRTVSEDAADVNAASDIVQLVPRACTDGPPHTFDGCLRGVEHLERGADGTVRVSGDAVGFTLDFPPDYCRSTDLYLQFRVARVHVALVHPNCRGGVLCLGPHFRPGTRVRPLVQQIYGIVSGRIAATHHAFDAPARDYYLRHAEQIRALRARPLWRRAVARSIRRGDVAAVAAAGGGDE